MGARLEPPLNASVKPESARIPAIFKRKFDQPAGLAQAVAGIVAQRMEVLVRTGLSGGLSSTP
jgi:hypothetical protein